MHIPHISSRSVKAALITFAPAFLACSLAASHALAQLAKTDPFGTEQLVSPARGQVHPCASRLPADAVSLMNAVDMALCNNPQTRQAWANVRAQAAQTGVAKSAYLPSINATLSADRNWSDTGRTPSRVVTSSPFNDRNANLAVSYLLYDFGARNAELENARQLLAAAAATQDNTIQAVLLSVVQAFYQVQAGIAAVNAAQLSERSSLKNVDAANARYKAGVATPADRLQAQTSYSQAVLVRVQAEGTLKNAQGTLANAMGLDAYTSLMLTAAPETTPPENLMQDIAALVEDARQRRPDLAAAQAQWMAAHASVEAARAAGRPSLSLAASTGVANESGFPNSHATTIGVRLDIPLFSGFATTYRIRAAQAQADATAEQFERLRLQVALDVWQSYQNLVTAMQSIRTTADLLASAEQSQRVAFGRYRSGVGTITDLLSAESTLAAARQQRVQSLFNWNVARATLAQAMGRLDYSLLETMPGAGQSDPEKKDRKQ